MPRRRIAAVAAPAECSTLSINGIMRCGCLSVESRDDVFQLARRYLQNSIVLTHSHESKLQTTSSKLAVPTHGYTYLACSFQVKATVLTGYMHSALKILMSDVPIALHEHEHRRQYLPQVIVCISKLKRTALIAAVCTLSLYQLVRSVFEDHMSMQTTRKSAKTVCEIKRERKCTRRIAKLNKKRSCAAVHDMSENKQTIARK
eukprot:6175297-Pleurochrysis_carterae.AAC.3